MQFITSFDTPYFSFPLDHLLIGAPDLPSGIAWVAEHLGVTPTPGGRHPELGTHNALTGLGGARYLEVIAPDPEGTGLAPPFAWLASFPEPAVATWAVAVEDLSSIASSWTECRFRHSPIMAGSRRRPDGSLLEWQMLFPDDNDGGSIPFFISWQDPARHPALSLPHELELEALSLVPGELERMKKIFDAAGLYAAIQYRDSPHLSATIRGPLGIREIR